MNSAIFWDRIANRYAKKPVPDEAAYQRKLAISRQFFAADSRLLEFGCGTGTTALNHASQVEHIHAIDISRQMIEIARDKASAAGIYNVSFEQNSIEALAEPSAGYDAVLALSILHLLDHEESAIKKVRRLLKPGGVFISSTVCLGDNLKFFQWVAPLGRRLGLMPTLKIFTQQELIDRVTQNGFDIEQQWAPESSNVLFLVARRSA